MRMVPSHENQYFGRYLDFIIFLRTFLTRLSSKVTVIYVSLVVLSQTFHEHPKLFMTVLSETVHEMPMSLMNGFGRKGHEQFRKVMDFRKEMKEPL